MTPIRWRTVDDEASDGVDRRGQASLFGEAVRSDGDEVFERRPGEGQFAGMEFLHVRARTIINSVPAASRMPFRHTINVYRGCSHACVYCFARPTHEYLGLDSGEDFERRIVVKVNAVERLRAELRSPRWRGEAIAMGTNTDPYQRCEGKYRLTRGIVEALGAAANPFSILTKSTLILRDLDVLTEAARRTEVHTSLSVGTLDEDVWRATEPGTPHPRRRIDAVRQLNDAGIPCGVLVAPVLPHLSDRPEQLEEVVQAAADAGAVSIGGLLLHLRPGVRAPFFDRLRHSHPELVATYERLYPRSYAPRSRQAELSAVLQELLDRHPPKRRRRRIGAPPRADPTRSATTPSSPTAGSVESVELPFS